MMKYTKYGIPVLTMTSKDFLLFIHDRIEGGNIGKEYYIGPALYLELLTDAKELYGIDDEKELLKALYVRFKVEHGTYPFIEAYCKGIIPLDDSLNQFKFNYPTHIDEFGRIQYGTHEK